MTTVMRRPKLFETRNKHTTVSVGISENTNSPALRTINKNSGAKLESLRSKLIANPNPQPVGKETKLNPDMSYLETVTTDTGMSVAEARGLLDSLPDLELSKQIIVSSILSPNDMLQTELIYGCETDFFGDISQPLIKVIKDYFDNVYKIKKLLPEMIGKAIFTDGAYPMAIFPESTIDSAINSNLKITKESLELFDTQIQQNLGILGNPDRIIRPNVHLPKRAAILSSSFESFTAEKVPYVPTVHTDDLMLTVTDNPLILRAPKMVAKLAKNKIIQRYGGISYSPEFYNGYSFATDNNKKENDTSSIYPTRTSKLMPILDMSDVEASRDNVGHPVVFTPPTEAVIPVYEPGSPHIHIGYFIALDETGNPISTAEYDDQFKDLQSKTKNVSNSNSNSYGTGGTSTVSSYSNYKEVASSVLGTKDNSAMDAEEAAKQYAIIVESELEQRLKNGDYNEKHTVAKATRIYRMMFTRACQAMHTQLLYVPIEFMTYLAYDYKHNGVGRSLLEKTKSIASLRMVNLMADSIASIKNAINHKDIDIVLDPNDPDPMKTIEQFLDEFTKATTAEFPVGMLNFADITDSLKRAGVSVSVSGHPGVPETNMKVNYNNNSLAVPDKDFDERLQKRNIMALGIPPDSVNSAAEMEFAKNIVTYNYLSAKINIVRQEITCEHLGDFIRKYTRNSSILIKTLEEIIDKNRDKLEKEMEIKNINSRDLALYFINYINVSLPEPDTSKLENELENFNKYKDALDAFLPAFISEELLSADIVGQEIGNAMNSLLPIIKGHFLRRYLAKHNIMPELFTLIASGDMENENFDILEQHEEYIKGVLPAFRRFIIRMLQAGGHTDGVINAAKEILSQIQGNPDDANADMDSGDTGGDEGGEDDYGDDLGDDEGDGGDEGDYGDEGDGESEDGGEGDEEDSEDDKEDDEDSKDKDEDWLS